MIAARDATENAGQRLWFWWLLYALVTLYVAGRMGAFALSAAVPTPAGLVQLPNTFASVDHPFHIARAEALWRTLSSGQLLRWIGQHQGGYPVEFYPLGEAWLEVAVRALSLNTLSAPGAHTLAVIALFLAPGIAFCLLAGADGWSPAVGVMALVLHVSLPGSWYDGGYTELVQWGLVTNVAAAVASLLMLPLVIRFLVTGKGWPGAATVAFAAAAFYSNPRSSIGLAALGAGAWLALALRRHIPARRGDACVAPTDRGWVGAITLRAAQVAGLAALLAAPELMALARFGDLYRFVRYSGYDEIAAYITAAAGAVTVPVAILGLAGLAFGLAVRDRIATTAAAMALVLYMLLTVVVAFFPAAARLAPQLEPTRLMPLQRFLTIYLAAVAIWLALTWIVSRVKAAQPWAAPLAATALAAMFLLIQTRPLDVAPDPATPAAPPVSLYAVATSAQPQQADLEAAVRAADAGAPPGTALLVVGSALSWHQQLWAPLWTERPLFYDNWLWYWHPDHDGTPGYAFAAGHHYPDPERTLDPDYLARHGIGAVVVTTAVREAAAVSPLLRPLHGGIYDAYAVIDPVATVTFDGQNALDVAFHDQRVWARAESAATSIVIRANWHPRWRVIAGENGADVSRRSDGYFQATLSAEATQVVAVYALQPVDWAARLLALIGFTGLIWFGIGWNQRGPAERWRSNTSGSKQAPERSKV